MNCLHALKSSACCLALFWVGAIAGCQTTTPSVTVSPTISPVPTPVVSSSPTSTPKSEAVKTFEKRLRGELIKKAGITVQLVNCPTAINVEKDPFICEATAEGKTFQVAVNPQNATEQQDKNELRWSTKGVLVLPKLEQTIQKGIQQQFRLEVKANCGGKIRIAKPGDTFQCQVTDSRGQSRAVKVRVDDDRGNVTWKL